MKTQRALIAALRERFPDESDAAIARRAKLSQPRFFNYVRELRAMDDDALLGCCALVGWEPKRTLAMHHAETAKTDRERAFWRQLAAAAAVAAVAIVSSSGMTQVPEAMAYFPLAFTPMHIMSIAMATLAGLICLIAARRLPSDPVSRFVAQGAPA